MSTAAGQPNRLTTDAYERMAGSGLLPERGVELIGGLVVAMSPKGDRHRRAANSLNAQFNDQRRGRYEVNADSLSLRLSLHDEFEPDIALARVAQPVSLGSPRPDQIALIVEVADSSLAYDLGEKRAKYARAGIPEYWVVDLQTNAFHVFRDPIGDVYAEQRTLSTGETVSPAEYPDAVVDIGLALT